MWQECLSHRWTGGKLIIRTAPDRRQAALRSVCRRQPPYMNLINFCCKLFCSHGALFKFRERPVICFLSIIGEKTCRKLSHPTMIVQAFAACELFRATIRAVAIFFVLLRVGTISHSTLPGQTSPPCPTLQILERGQGG